jgi:alginate O-acetyltransferase complex protein AlgI
MPFSSVAFLLGFLPLTVAGCLLVRRLGPSWLKLWLIAVSVLFYGLNAPHQFLVLPILLGVDLALAWALRTSRRAGLLAGCGVGLNLAVLCWCKYLAPAIWPDASLPPGISFFVFTQIGLLLWLAAQDAGQTDLLDLTLFSVFFPVILSGPILNPHDTLPEFRRGHASQPDGTATAQRSNSHASFDELQTSGDSASSHHVSSSRVIQTSGNSASNHHALGLTAERVSVGLGFFFIGLAKKALLADPLGHAVAAGFSDPATAGTLGAWLAAVSWYLQLYLDFSGYTDMAIGLAWLVGIHLPDNFDQPYRAGSVIQYWQCWHMSLTRFLMANVHTPLTLAVLRRRRRLGFPINEAAQRSAFGFTAMIGAPIVTTMLLVGVWHGAQLTYGLFGLLHAGYLLVNHAWRLQRRPPLPPAVAVGLTQFAVLIGAVVFRAATPEEAGGVLKAMAGLNGFGAFDLHTARVLLRVAGLLGLIWFAPTTRQFMLEEARGLLRGPRLHWRSSPGMALAMGCLAALGVLACSGTQTFVYFNF